MRHPRGTIVHSIPSFNPRRMLGAANGQAASSGHNPAIGLFNNATDGSWLVVWDFQAGIQLPAASNNIQSLSFSFIAGDGATGVQFPGTPIVDQQAGLFGTVWANYNQGNSNAVFYNPSNANYLYTWPHEWPLAYVRPGDSIVCAGDDSSSGFLTVSYLWEVVKEL